MSSQINLFDGLVVDNFAGGGGASTGIELALGRPVDIAINHDKDAIAMHTVNHPYTKHYCESVWDVDPRKATNGLPVTLAWFSPDCKHFSKARGGKPVDKNIRFIWPAPTHGKGLKPYRTAAEIIDRSLPCPSIFDTSEEIRAKYGITAVRPLAEALVRANLPEQCGKRFETMRDLTLQMAV